VIGGLEYRALDMDSRYVKLFNKFITAPATQSIAKLISHRVALEVCETLPAGMPVFYADHFDRIRILSELVNEALTKTSQSNPVRMLLLNKFF